MILTVLPVLYFSCAGRLRHHWFGGRDVDRCYHGVVNVGVSDSNMLLVYNDVSYYFQQVSARLIMAASVDRYIAVCHLLKLIILYYEYFFSLD